MEALLNIADWYASPDDTFIKMYNTKKALHLLPKLSTNKMVMQEVSYHISTGLLAGLHRKRKEPWPMLPLRIGLYVIQSLKEANSKVEVFKKFKFYNKSFNPYDLHGLCRDHCLRVYYPWIRGACH